MGLEIIVVVFALLSVTFGIVIPVALWALWLGRGERLLVDDLRERGLPARPAVTTAATAIAAIRVHLDGREAEIQATSRGRVDVWRVSVPRPSARTTPIRAARVLDRAWAASRARDHDDEVRGLDGAPGHAIVGAPRVDDEAAAAADWRRVAEILAHSTIVDLRVDDDAVVVESRRHALVAAEARAALARALALADVLDGTSTLHLLPSARHTFLEGSATGIPAIT